VSTFSRREDTVKSLLWLAALAAGSLALTASAAEDKKSDVKGLQGTWKVQSFEASDGGGPPPDEVGKIRFTFAKDTLTIDVGDMKHTAKYKTDAGKKPGHIDVIPEDGPEAGKTLAGIYELSGDTLKLCVSHSTTRPTEFAAKGERVIYTVLKRDKK
jgi:uncharacterized protein (TIGR03067 family)